VHSHECAADPAGGEDHRLGAKENEAPVLAPVAEGAANALSVGEEARHRALHVDLHSAVDAMLLEGADHLQARAIAHVGEARILVTPEVTLEDSPVRRAVEEGPPLLQLLHPIRGFHGVELRHAPLVQIAAALHGVAEVNLPVVSGLHVSERGGDTSLGHDGVRLAEERLAHQTHARALGAGLDGRAQTGPAGAYDQDIVLVRLVLDVGHQKSLASVMAPLATARM
jgi:hypothetical protein